MSHPIFEESTSPLTWSNDGRLQVVKQDNPRGSFCVVDDTDHHVELFTMKREIADAFIAGYDYRERLSREDVEQQIYVEKRWWNGKQWCSTHAPKAPEGRG